MEVMVEEWVLEVMWRSGVLEVWGGGVVSWEVMVEEWEGGDGGGVGHGGGGDAEGEGGLEGVGGGVVSWRGRWCPGGVGGRSGVLEVMVEVWSWRSGVLEVMVE
ncbi:hypothetical protein Hamer_G014944 [Homarus americanus]|uniref:Uncharacterized protein n=1 Tax=Homarus americanus TaxID=6706 RepID=A0A8J5MK94_HOMAM|nr:hypothetical protein Hamer_G014944 [Homarus americanus]